MSGNHSFLSAHCSTKGSTHIIFVPDSSLRFNEHIIIAFNRYRNKDRWHCVFDRLVVRLLLRLGTSSLLLRLGVRNVWCHLWHLEGVRISRRHLDLKVSQSSRHATELCAQIPYLVVRKKSYYVNVSLSLWQISK